MNDGDGHEKVMCKWFPHDFYKQQKKKLIYNYILEIIYNTIPCKHNGWFLP